MKLLDAILPAVPAQRLSLGEAYLEQQGYGLGGLTTFSVGGQTYTVPVQTTMSGQKAEAIANSFEGYVAGGLAGNGVIFNLASVRLRVFTEARLQWQSFNKGRPGDLFGDGSLALLEEPWPGGTTGDLLAVMLLHADFAGNNYTTVIGGQMVPMRPDWVDILLGDRAYTDSAGQSGAVGMEKLGYAYYHGGKQSGVQPVVFLANEVAHFAPQPDPLAWYRGMSWLTPVIRETKADGAATGHKLAFFENAATPNLAVSLKEITDPDEFGKFVDKMDDAHKGWQNAYKTLYLGAGADVTVIGANMHEIDFSNTQGAGEVRLAGAAGVPPVVANLWTAQQGSTLNSGNFAQARRQFADTTMSHLWRNAAGSLQMLATPPGPATRLWYDTRDIPFLREDQKDRASIQASQAQAVREYFMAGFEPDSILAAVSADDLRLLKHTGLYSIQVQAPGVGSTRLPATVDTPPPGPVGSVVEKPVPVTVPAKNGNGNA